MNRHILKVACVFVSILIWIQVASSDMRKREADLPLRIDGLPESLTLVGNDWPESVRVRGRGSKWRFFLSRYFGNQPGEVVVDLSGVDPDVPFVRELTAADVRTSLTEVEVLDAAPLELDVDHMDSLRVVVDVMTRGELPAGWMLLAPPRAEPDSVTVRGPSRFLPEVSRVRTEPVDMTRIHGAGPVSRTLVAPHAHVEPVSGTVHVVVEAVALGHRVFEHLPLVPLLDAGQIHVEIFPPVASVEISGPAEVLAALSAASISLTVSSSGLAPGAHTVRPSVMLPEHCSLVALAPEEFMLVVGGGARPGDAP
jgi:YbbR domain-containing protein